MTMSTADDSDNVKENKTTTKTKSYWRYVLQELFKNKGAIVGLVMLALLIILAIIAPHIAPYRVAETTVDILKPPSQKHLLGTDVYGRDIFSRVLLGTQYSLRIGVISVGVGLAFGLILGIVGGFYGGRVDNFVVMIIDAMLSFPPILLALAIIAVLGPGLFNVMIAVGISHVPRYARLARSEVVSVKEETFVEGARSVGANDMSIMIRHIMPNIVGPLFVLATLSIPVAILSAAGLSFLGLGAQPPTPEWGLMVSSGREYLRRAWWVATFPGLAIMITVLSINLLGDGLRDANDPRLRET